MLFHWLDCPSLQNQPRLRPAHCLETPNILQHTALNKVHLWLGYLPYCAFNKIKFLRTFIKMNINSWCFKNVQTINLPSYDVTLKNGNPFIIHHRVGRCIFTFWIKIPIVEKEWTNHYFSCKIIPCRSNPGNSGQFSARRFSTDIFLKKLPTTYMYVKYYLLST